MMSLLKTKAAPVSTAEPMRPLTTAMRRRMAARPPSFTELLPWTDYEADTEVFHLQDGVSVAALFELVPIPTEAQTDAFLSECQRRVQAAVEGVPESDTAEWIVQFFANDDRNIEHLAQSLRDHVREVHAKDLGKAQRILDSQLTQAVIKDFAEHLSNVSQVEGLFEDTQVSGHAWRGQVRRIRCCLYRMYTPAHDFSKELDTPEATLNRVATRFAANLTEAGVKVRRGNGRDLYEWLLPFFNRKGYWNSPGDLLRNVPYPGDRSPHEGDQAPVFGWDLSEFLNLRPPKSDPDHGCFVFDGVPVKALTLQRIKSSPQAGHLSAERRHGDHFFARLDRLPANSMLSITVTIRAQDAMRGRVEQIRDRSKAISAEAQQTYKECDQILDRMTLGDKLFPTFIVLYVSGDGDGDVRHERLRHDIATVNSQLDAAGLQFIELEHDLAPFDAFIRGLPMAFDPQFDGKHLRRSRLLFASQIAALAPVYGRQRGTGHPAFMFWNRGGEPMWVDPLDKRDRKKNAHLLTMGPTGSGKSATLNLLLLFVMAIHWPRLFIADAGKSFGLLKDYFARLGLKTHYVELNPNSDVSLPPFALAAKLLDDPEFMAPMRAAGGVDEGTLRPTFEAAEQAAAQAVSDAGRHGAESEPSGDHEQADKDEETPERRDYLGEMLISAIMMITGGEEEEVKKLTRADRYVVSRAIVNAAITARKGGAPHPLVQDVAVALMDIARDARMMPARQLRAAEMGEAMMVFTQGLRGQLFNRYGQKWPDADVTLVELGIVAQNDEYKDALAVAYTALIDHVHATGEAHQHEGRDNIFLTDEGHVVTTNSLLGPKIAKGTKMWRKLSIWFWLATQDMKDFPDSMSRVLNMCEFWLLLTMEKAEIEEVARFKKLSDEQRALMISCKKEPPKYTEGVLLSSATNALFRNVSPPIAIALAMTEGHEKAARRRLMEQHGCSELDAALMVARELAGRRV